MVLGEGSYCVIERYGLDKVRKVYRSIGSLNTFIEHYLHTQVPPYDHLIHALYADETGYVLPRYKHDAYSLVGDSHGLLYSRDQLFQFGLQLIYAVEYLHQLGFVHGDLSLGNLLFTDVDKSHLVLCDFNMSEFMGYPNRTIVGERSYINYYRHYRNITHGELSATSDWYATAILLSELWGQTSVVNNWLYRKYRCQLGVAPRAIVQGTCSRNVGLDRPLDDDTKEAITAAMFFSDDRLRREYYQELRLVDREVDVLEVLFNYQDGDDVLSLIKWTGPAPLPDLTEHRRSVLYQQVDDHSDRNDCAADVFNPRMRFYRQMFYNTGIERFGLNHDEIAMASFAIDRWYARDKTLYLDHYPVNDLVNPEALASLRRKTGNNIYGRLVVNRDS